MNVQKMLNPKAITAIKSLKENQKIKLMRNKYITEARKKTGSCENQ